MIEDTVQDHPNAVFMRFLHKLCKHTVAGLQVGGIRHAAQIARSLAVVAHTYTGKSLLPEEKFSLIVHDLS